MIAVIHIGLHKTGTTYLQALCNENPGHLLARGVYYPPQPRYPAHHAIAWRVLVEDYQPLREAAAAAREAGATTLLLSSEDLEGLIFRPAIARGLISALHEAGASRVVFMLAVRRQDETFWSLYAELSRHVYLDHIAVFERIMRMGYLDIIKPRPQTDNPPYWYFSFDHETNINRFRSDLDDMGEGQSALWVYDFDAPGAFPGGAMLRDIGVREPPANPADPRFANLRLHDADVRANYLARFAEHLPADVASTLLPAAEARLRIDPAVRALISRALVSRFHAGNQRLAERYPPKAA